MPSLTAAIDVAPRDPRASAWLWGVVGLWALAVAAGLWSLWNYAAIPGPATAAPTRWPEASGLARPPGRWALVMFIHPRCPCSRASLEELEKLQAQSGGMLDVLIAGVRPAGADPDWLSTAAIRRAAALKGTRLVIDDEGRLARHFQARTSGETFLYDPAGQLAFHGGLTATRGHQGDNPGSQAVLACLCGTLRNGATTTPAFGCPLFDDRLPQGAAQGEVR